MILIHPSSIFLSIHSVNTWNRIKAPFSQSRSITTISSINRSVVLRGRLFLPLSCTLTHTTAAGLFRARSLALLAEGTSNHNCKLIICPRRWLRIHSHPRLILNTSSVILSCCGYERISKTYWADIRERLVENLMRSLSSLSSDSILSLFLLFKREI